MNTVKIALAKGLTAGFAGKSTYTKVKRGKFAVESSSFDEDGISYIDQWMPSRLGGGQEIVEVDGMRYTRVYAGGAVEKTKLASLGITEADVMDCLKTSLLVAKEKTRFDALYTRREGKWTYTYTPGVKDKIVGIITGKETISYNNVPVFVHFLLISPVKA